MAYADSTIGDQEVELYLNIKKSDTGNGNASLQG